MTVQAGPGDRVELVWTDETYTRLTQGDRGTVVRVTDEGDLAVEWDSGSGLMLIVGEDLWQVVDDG